MTPPKKNLFALLKKAPGRKEYWFINLLEETVTDFLDEGELARALKNGVVVVFDGKAFLKEQKVSLSPSIQLICLTTVAQLLGKKTIVEPQLISAEDALRWAKKTVENALNHIEKQSMKALVNLESNVIVASLAMEQRGLYFDAHAWQKTLEQLQKEAGSIKEQLQNLLVHNEGFLLFGAEPIDLSNQMAVKKALEALLCQTLSSTAQSALQHIDHEAVKLYLRFRECSRILSTYGEQFLRFVRNDRLYGNFIPLGCASGRFACHEANLLALPNHDMFQRCLQPKKPLVVLHFDYSAFELRILASLSKDEAMLSILNSGQDIHSMVAQAVFNKEVSKTKNVHLRDQAKILNFGIIYGMGEKALAKQLKISLGQAETLLQSYFKRFFKVGRFLRDLEKQAEDEGFVQTALGRRQYFNPQEYSRSQQARIARNMPIQGTGADIAKLALCKVFKALYEKDLKAHLINLVHDELVVECHKNTIDEVSAIVKTEMAGAMTTVLPDINAEVSVAYDSPQV